MNPSGYTQWAVGAHVRAGARRRLRRAVAAELPRVPAAHEARQLQPRPRDGIGHQAARQRQVMPALIAT